MRVTVSLGQTVSEISTEEKLEVSDYHETKKLRAPDEAFGQFFVARPRL
jgi:hypothetical protein